jgi:hypothetical protein
MVSLAEIVPLTTAPDISARDIAANVRAAICASIGGGAVDGGILSRVISFWGSPLGGASEATGNRIKATMRRFGERPTDD